MNMNEEKYLRGLIGGIVRFDCFLEGMYYMTRDKSDKYGKIQDIDTWFNKVNSLVHKINYSLLLAIENENMIKDEGYNPFKDCEQKDVTYYYIENAMFRLSTLWDTLAQLVNVFYELNISISDIHYNKVFKNENIQPTNIMKEKDRIQFAQFRSKVRGYLLEDNNTSIQQEDGFWKGNHKYINELRNRIVHRNDPHSIAILNRLDDSGFGLPEPPLFELKRLIEDYSKCDKFLKEIYKNIFQYIDETFSNRPLLNNKNK
jgi:hypothetical protein